MARLQVGQKSWLASKSSKSFCRCGGIMAALGGWLNYPSGGLFHRISDDLQFFASPTVRLNIAVRAGERESPVSVGHYVLGRCLALSLVPA